MSIAAPNRRWMSPPPVYDSHSAINVPSRGLKPYLQLPHLLSLTWLAYPILSLLFVAFRLQISLASSQDAVNDARGDLLTSCTAAEQAATAAASMPRYMATSANKQFAEAVNGSMDGARAALILSLTVMEAIINFIIDTYRSTFLCFLELVVQGGLSLLIGAVQEISSAVTSTMNSIRTGIQNDVASANSVIQSAVSGINKLKVFGNVSIPEFSIPSLSALQNVTIPTDFENALITLNNSLPSLSDLKSTIDNLVDTPFEAVKADINNTFANITFDPSLLPVPPQNTLAFCNDLDTSFVDDLGQDLFKVARIGTIIIILLALLLLAANCVYEWYKWRCLRHHLQHIREVWISDPTIYHTGPAQAPTVTMSDHNLMMLQADSSHPVLTRFANTLTARLHLTPTQHINLKWFFHYVFHPPALACFMIGFFGLLSVELQLLAVRPLEAKYTAQASASVTNFSNTIALSVNTSMYNQSSFYADGINSRVDAVQQTINDGLFGWVNGTTTTLNNSINAFYDDIQNTVALVFNGTILESPVQDFIKCLIGSKVDAIEDALTFLHNNLNINLPTVNESVLVLSPADVNEVTQPVAQAAIGGGSSNSQGVVGKLVNTYVSSLQKERIMFGVFMILWGVVVFMALCIIFWNSYGQACLEARRKKKWEREQRGSFSGITSSRGNVDQDAENAVEKFTLDLPSFTPMPSPRPSSPFKPFSWSNRNSANPNTNPSLPANASDPRSEKSWDSFFDRLDAEKDSQRKTISRPMKLRAIGRKGMGREILLGDGTSDTVVDDAETKGRVKWFSNLRAKLGMKRGDFGDGASSTGGSSFTVRSRPNLTISVDRASNEDVRPTDRTVSRDLGPSSAWSTSPTPPRLPWMNIVTPTKKFVQARGLPPRPKLVRHASIHSEVASPHGDTSPLMQPMQPTPAPVPLHYGYGPRVPTLAENLAPPRDQHRRSMSLPSAEALQQTVNDSTTPITRFLTTNHARHSSMAFDPFATPFDDEHQVRAGLQPGKSSSPPTNPFAAIAV